MSKVYVEVEAVFTEDGTMRPACIRWTDGSRYEIDKVTEVKRAVSLAAGGCGLRYTCRINGHSSFLFYGDEGRWFVEGRGGGRNN